MYRMLTMKEIKYTILYRTYQGTVSVRTCDNILLWLAPDPVLEP